MKRPSDINPDSAGNRTSRVNDAMPIWIALLVILATGLCVLSCFRLKILRDPGREGIDDHESTLAYDRVSRWVPFVLIRFHIVNQLKRYQPKGILMDAGCGPGYLALAIARRYPRLAVTGIDLSREMVRLAGINQSSSRLNSRVTFKEANVQELPFESNYLDFTISTFSLHHWSDPGQALLEIYRVLKPGGQMLIFDLRRDMPRILLYLIYLVQRFFAPHPIRRVNGGVGSVWSSFTASEMEGLVSRSPLHRWKVQRGWGWAYIWGQK